MSVYFSVIITTYNRADLLERALNSLKNQTEKDWEAIIIDDGSTDDTATVIQSFLDENIHYFKQENKGAIQAKNKGIELSKGQYITFLDSDDEYKPNHLKSRKGILEKHPEIELLHGGVEIIGSQYVPDYYNTGKMIHLSKCVIGGTFFMKREALQILEGFKNDTLGMDADFFERAAQANIKIIKTELPTYVYHRTGDNSITHNFLK